MKVPLEISFKDLSPSESEHAHAMIDDHVAKLERIAGDAISCRVSVSKPQRHQRSGSAYRVCIRLTLPPNHELVVTKEPGDQDAHDHLGIVLRDAFRAMERQIKSTVERRRYDVKVSAEPLAFVFKLFRDSGYGFIKTPDGEELYFHKNSVLHHDFDRLTIGTQVRYDATLGDKGPQATSVQVVDKPGVRRTPTGEVEDTVPSSWRP